MSCISTDRDNADISERKKLRKDGSECFAIVVTFVVPMLRFLAIIFVLHIYCTSFLFIPCQSSAMMYLEKGDITYGKRKRNN